MAKLEVGEIAPDFTLPLAGGGSFTLSQALTKVEKGYIIYFYPRAMTPGCTTEACDFRDAYSELQKEGYGILGISPDPVERLEKFQAKQTLNFSLAADPEKEVLSAWGAYGEKKNFGKIVRGVIRSTFVVGKDGKIVQAEYGVRAKGHVDRLQQKL